MHYLELVYEDGDGVELIVRIWRVSHGERGVRRSVCVVVCTAWVS